MKKIYAIAIFIFLVFKLNAADRYWVGPSGGSWNSSANWSDTTGGSGGFSVPGSGDRVYFDGNGNTKCLINANVNVYGINIGIGYTDTIVQGSTYTITIGASNWTMNNGVFIGGDSNISVEVFTLNAGSFTSTSGTFFLYTDFTKNDTATFNHNYGKVSIQSKINLYAGDITGNTTFYDLDFNAPSYNKTVTINPSTILTVENNLELKGGATVRLFTGTIHLKKDLTTTYGTNTGPGSTEIVLNGSGNQTITGQHTMNGALPKIRISKSPSDTTFLIGKISADNNWTLDSGYVDPGDSWIAFSRPLTITGNFTFNKVLFQRKNSGGTTYTLSSGTVVTVLDTFKTNGSNIIALNGGTYECKGNILLAAVSESNDEALGTSVIQINGVGTQYIYGSSAYDNWLSGYLRIDKGSDTLKLRGAFSIGREWRLLSGIIDADTSTVGFYRVAGINGLSHSLNNIIFYSTFSSNATFTIADSTNITALGSLTLDNHTGNSSITILGGHIYAKGDITLGNNGNPSGNHTTVFHIDGMTDQMITGAGSLKSPLPKCIINKSSGTLYLNGTISMLGHWQFEQGTIDATTYNSTLQFQARVNTTITGTQTFNNFSIYKLSNSSTSFTIASGSVVTLEGNFTTESVGTTAFNGGDLKVKGNITLSNMLNGGSGRIHLIGDTVQTITGTSSVTDGEIPNLTINKPLGSVTIHKLVTVIGNTDLLKGIVNTKNADSLLVIPDNATLTNGSDSSFISGPVIKIGNDAFTFRTGGNNIYKPISISAPSLSTDQFTAEFKAEGQILGSTKDSTLRSLADCEYWKLNRNAGISKVNVKLNWSEESCNIPYYLNNTRLAYWNGISWNDKGMSSVTGSRSSGSITVDTIDVYGYYVIAETQTNLSDIIVNNIEPVTLYHPESGTVDIEAIGGYLPLIYAWSDNSTDEDADSLVQGSYTITITDARDSVIQKTVYVDTECSLNERRYSTYIENEFAKNSVLLSDHTSESWGVSGAISDNVITENTNGFAQATILNADDIICFSLTDYDYGDSPENVKYGMLIENRKIKVYMDSSGIAPFIATYTSGDTVIVDSNDVIKVERLLSGTIHAYYKFTINDTLFYEVRNEDRNRQLIVDIAFKSPGASLKGIRGSFTEARRPNFLCQDDGKKNYSETIIYDENGNVISHSRTYFDLLGRPVQSQSKDFENSNVLASQTIYDQWGRAVLGTLPAPLYQTAISCYSDFFVRNDNGTVYTHQNFDKKITATNLTGEAYNPDNVNNAIKGSLGWYYSNRNTSEAYVAASGFPYNRVEYHADPLGRIKSSSQAGEKLAMGTGSEGGIFNLTYGNELIYVAKYLNGKQLNKTATRDSEGAESVSWTDAFGNVIATARSGLTGYDRCDIQWAKSLIEMEGTASVSIHVPAAAKSSVKIQFPDLFMTGHLCNSPASPYTTGFSDVELTIVDLKTNLKLNSSDYSLSSSGVTMAITFNGQYATGSHFFRISLDYSDDYECVFYQLHAFPVHLPNAVVYYKQDYSHFTLNEYSATGQLTKSYSPEAIDCGNYDPANSPQNQDWYGLGALIYDPNTTSYKTGQTVRTYSYITESAIQPNTSFNPEYTDALYDRRLSIRFKNFATIIEVDPQDYALRCDASQADFIYNDKEIEGGNVSWTMSKENLFRGTGGTPVLVSSGAVADVFARRWLYGHNYNKAMVDEEGEDCFGTAHCYDGVQNCSETSTDVGSNCPEPLCADEPPVQIATYEYTFSLRGYNGTTETILDADGVADPNATFVFYASLYKTCSCEYFFDASQLSQFIMDIDEDKLVNYTEIRIHLEQIKVKVEPAITFASLNASDPIHDFARGIQFSADFTLWITPEIASQPHITSNNFANQYFYTAKHELSRTIMQDEGTSEMVNDDYGRARFSRNALQAANSQFAYMLYDRSGRVTETGVYITGTSGSLVFYETDNSDPDNVHREKNDYSSPANCSSCTDRTNYVYDFPQDLSSLPSPYNTYVQKNTTGRIVKSYNENSVMWYSYNMYGQVEWTLQWVVELNTYYTHHYTYNYLGNLTKSDFQQSTSAEAYYHYYYYDANQRLEEVKTCTTGVENDAVLDVEYLYYLHGALKRKEFGTDLQGADYVYTINGWLKSINAPELSDRDPGKDSYTGTNQSFAKDVFGMTIDYFTGDYLRNGTHVQTFDMGIIGGFEEGQHNGNIKAIRWQAGSSSTSSLSFDGNQLMYYYQYDDFNQLKTSDFFTITANGTLNGFTPLYGGGYAGPTAASQTAYAEKSITYDLNGNLKSLQRKDNAGTTIDDFTYNYNTNSNRLDYVGDNVLSTVASYDVDNQSTGNYVYNAIGQILEDNQKDVGYIYNAAGLVERVYVLSTGYKFYEVEYDEKGKRLKKVRFNSSTNAPVETTWYIRDATGQITSTYSQLPSQSATQEEVMLNGGGMIGSYVRANNEKKFQLTDHLGNVRVVFKNQKVNGEVVITDLSDYYPFGATMPGRNQIPSDPFNFSYQGQETMDINGIKLVNFELRNYDPYLGRWMSADPYHQFYSPYLAMFNNPVRFVDPDGGWGCVAEFEGQVIEGCECESEGDAGSFWANVISVGGLDTYISSGWNPLLLSFLYEINPSLGETAAKHAYRKGLISKNMYGEYGTWNDEVTGGIYGTYNSEGETNFKSDLTVTSVFTPIKSMFSNALGNWLDRGTNRALTDIYNFFDTPYQTPEMKLVSEFFFKPVIEDIKILSTGTDINGDPASRGWATVRLAAEIIPIGKIVKVGKIGGKVISSMGKADEVHSIYRVVSKGELDDLTNGFRQAPFGTSSYEGKLFWENMDDAQWYLNWVGPENHIIKVGVQNGFIYENGFDAGRLFLHVSGERLDLFNSMIKSINIVK